MLQLDIQPLPAHQSVHVLQLPALLLQALALHLNDKQQGLLLRLPECTWAAMRLWGGAHRVFTLMFS